MKFIYPIIMALFLVGCWDKSEEEAPAEEAAQVQEEAPAEASSDANGADNVSEEAVSEEE